jgi:hypothetical protein
MNIESARALKEVVPPAVSAIHRAGGFSITTFSLNRMTKAEPLVALGIAQGTGQGDVRVAVRLQRRSLEHSQSMVEQIRQRAKNEVDVRFVGRIAKHSLPWYRVRQRPLLAGGSVGQFKITAGPAATSSSVTITCWRTKMWPKSVTQSCRQVSSTAAR